MLVVLIRISPMLLSAFAADVVLLRLSRDIRVGGVAITFLKESSF